MSDVLGFLPLLAVGLAVWALLRKRVAGARAAAESRSAADAEGGRATVNLGGIYLTLDASLLTALREAEGLAAAAARPAPVAVEACRGCGAGMPVGAFGCNVCGLVAGRLAGAHHVEERQPAALPYRGFER